MWAASTVAVGDAMIADHLVVLETVLKEIIVAMPENRGSVTELEGKGSRAGEDGLRVAGRVVVGVAVGISP